MKNHKGISLIALIITIIVIIILAAIVIGGVFSTPTQGKFARWCNDISRVQEAVNINRYTKIGEEQAKLGNELINEGSVYKWLATGNSDASTETILEKQMVKITDGNKLEMELPKYSGQEWFLDVSSGEVYMLPGFSYDDNLYMSQAEINLSKESVVRKLQPGDYVAYTPDIGKYPPDIDGIEQSIVTGIPVSGREYMSAASTISERTWKVWSNDGKTVKLIAYGGTNSLKLGLSVAYVKGYDILNAIALNLYSNKRLNATARSLNLEDLESVLTCTIPQNNGTNYAYFLPNDSTYESYDDVILFNGKEYTKTNSTYYNSTIVPEPAFYSNRDQTVYGGIEKENEYGIKYKTPANGNPVYVEYTGYEIHDATYKDLNNDKFPGETYGDLLQASFATVIPTTRVTMDEDSAYFSGYCLSKDALELKYSGGLYSRGGGSFYNGARLGVIVTLPASVLVDTSNPENDGSDAEHAWQLQ